MNGEFVDIPWIGPDRLYLYAVQGNLFMVDILLNHGDDPNARTSRGDAPLHASCRSCHEPVLTRLLSWGGDPNIMGCWYETPLHIASEKGWQRGITLLLAAGANVNCSDRGGYSPLATAIRFKQRDTARQLLEAGAEPR